MRDPSDPTESASGTKGVGGDGGAIAKPCAKKKQLTKIMFLNKPTKDILLATFMIKFSSTLFCLIPWGDVFKVFESFYLTNAAIVFSHITN
jgi:hypothetical protein